MKIIKENGMNYKLGFDNETKQFWYDWATNRGVRKGQFSGVYQAVDFVNKEAGVHFFEELQPKLNALEKETNTLENTIYDKYMSVNRELAYKKMQDLRASHREKERTTLTELALKYIDQELIKMKAGLL